MNKNLRISLEAIAFAIGGAALDAAINYLQSTDVFSWRLLLAAVLAGGAKAVPQLLSKNKLTIPSGDVQAGAKE